MLVAGFEWDHANRDKCQKHGVSVDAIGITDEGRYVLIVFALRIRDGETFIRPISARYMHRKEVRYYEEAAAKIRDR